MSIATSTALASFAEEVRNKVRTDHYTKKEAAAIYAEKASVPTKISQLNNDSGYVTGTDVDRKLSGLAKVVTLTQVEYDALAKKDSNTLYVISE